MWLVILSGIGLVTLVLLDLGESLRSQEQNARDVARRDSERGARELRTALLDPSWLDRWPDEKQFEIEAGELVVPDSVGWINRAPVFDPAIEFDPVLIDRLRRAERATEAEAPAMWSELREDPMARGAAGQWIQTRIAWFAHRAGNQQTRDELVEQVTEDAPDTVAISLLLLCAEARLPIPEWTRAALPRLRLAQAREVISQLHEHGVDVAADVLALKLANMQRHTLASAQPWVARLATSDQALSQNTHLGLILYYPQIKRGVWLQFRELQELANLLSLKSPDNGMPLDLGGTLVAGDEGAPVIAGFASVIPNPILEPRLLSGATGFGLLSVALALLCGGGAFFALRGARREAEAARLRTEFVTGVTHELKTPLTGIRLTADLLREGYVQDEERRQVHLTRLAAESLRLGVLIDNVLDLGRFERGERGHHPQRADLVELVGETVQLFEPIASSAALSIEFFRPPTPIVTMVDADALRQALLNVLDNARKYGMDGERVEVEITSDEHVARIRVRDFGPGVPEEERGLIFERFRRGAHHRDGSVPGVGLGLYFARVLMRKHGGELSYLQSASQGAQFELKFPMTTNEAQA